MAKRFFTLALTPESGSVKVLRIQADRYEDDGTLLSFIRDGRVVNRVPSAGVLEIEHFETDREAAEHARAIQKRKKGACSLQVQEVELPPRS